MSYNSRSGHGYGNIRKARKVQARRSDHAKAIDRRLKAPRARSVDQWLSAPNRFDLPTVDTNKPSKKKITISQFKVDLIKTLAELPEWITSSKEIHEDILFGLKHRPNKVRELYRNYIKSDKTITEWLKTVFE